MRFQIRNISVDLGAALLGSETLTPNEAGVLEELYKAEGDTVSRLHLYREVWGYTRMPRGRAVDFVVMRLRKKLEACGESADLIPTVRSRGFRLVDARAADAPPAPAFAVTAPAVPTVAPDMERPLDAFVGRTADLAELRDAVASHALVTVTGPPGVGKSRLVIEFLAQSGEPFVGISTTDLASEREVRAKLGAALQASPAGLEGDVTARLAQAPMRTLFIDDADVLANHPVQAIPRWLRSAPDLRIIVTSRRPLGVRGERLLRLAPLCVEQGRALFLQRAEEVDAEIADGSSARIDSLVESLDSLPLALELAASRLRVLDLEGLQAALSRRFRLLRRRGGGSLEGALEASWRALAPDEQAALARLCCLRGSFHLDEVASILEDLDTFWLDVLESLVDHSLLQHLGEAEGVFRTLLSVSAFVEEHAEPEVRAAARERMAHLLGTTGWGSARLADLLAAARWPEAAETGQVCRSRALRVAIRTGRFAAARDALALGGVAATPDDIQALSLLARLAGGSPFGMGATDADLDARVVFALADTAACLRWSSAEDATSPRQKLAAAVEAAQAAVEAEDWSGALDAYEDGLDQEGHGHDFGLASLQLVRMLALGRLGRPVAAQLREAERLALESLDTGMAALGLTSLLLVARFRRGVGGLSSPGSLSLKKVGLPAAAQESLDAAWALGGA